MYICLVLGASEEQAAAAVNQMMGAMAPQSTVSSSGSTGSGSGGQPGSSKANQLKMSSETVGSLLSEKLDEVAQLQAQFDAMKVDAENSPAQQHSRHVSRGAYIVLRSFTDSVKFLSALV